MILTKLNLGTAVQFQMSFQSVIFFRIREKQIASLSEFGESNNIHTEKLECQLSIHATQKGALTYGLISYQNDAEGKYLLNCRFS